MTSNGQNLSLPKKKYISNKAEYIVALFILSYGAIGIAMQFHFRGDIQLFLLHHLKIFLILAPASLFALYLFLIRSAMRKEKIRVPLGQWTKATALALTLSLFWPSFTSLKILIPHFVPFYFDIPLIVADRTIHFGIDPWVIAHKLRIFASIEFFDFIYFDVWMFLVSAFLVFLSYFDNNRTRKLHYIFLFIATWIILGNALAMIFSSAGPIYVRDLYGIGDFDPLAAALASTDSFSESFLHHSQKRLWENYISGASQIGSGISAFPSVHVGMAFVLFLYLSERSRLLVLPGLAYVGLVLIGSVFCGWHYAIDGYVSIIVVFVLHLAIAKISTPSKALLRQHALPRQPQHFFR